MQLLAGTPSLYALQVPSPEDDFGTEAAQLLAELSGGGKELNATIVQRERSATKVRLPGLLLPTVWSDTLCPGLPIATVCSTIGH